VSDRELLHIQEVGRLQVAVPHPVPGVDAGRLDHRLDPRLLDVLGDLDPPAEVGEPPVHTGDPQVLRDGPTVECAGSSVHAPGGGSSTPPCRASTSVPTSARPAAVTIAVDAIGAYPTAVAMIV
jgi:hypothetical protein